MHWSTTPIARDSAVACARTSQILMVLIFFASSITTSSHAQILYDITFDVIPGTEGITIGPGVQLSGFDLRRAWLGREDLTGADFSGTNLMDANFGGSTLANANFSDATIRGAQFDIFLDWRTNETIGAGLTMEQLESTASYQEGDLRGVGLVRNNLTDMDFSNQDLSDANLGATNLTNANMTGAVISGVTFGPSFLHPIGLEGTGITEQQLRSTSSFQSRNLLGVNLSNHNLSGWDLSGQDLTGVDFFASVLESVNFENAIINHARLTGITAPQLYSTASYRAKDLRGVTFGSDMTEWNLRQQNLTGARLANLHGADLSGAEISKARFGGAGLTNSMLSSTASYANGTMVGIQFSELEMTDDWDLSGLDLSDAWFKGNFARRINLADADLTGATFVGPRFASIDFSGANLTRTLLRGVSLEDSANASFQDATLRWTMLADTSGLTLEHIYSTASYQKRDLRGVQFYTGASPELFRGVDFSEQDLRGVGFSQYPTLPEGSDLTNASFRDANLAIANLGFVTLKDADLSGAHLGHANLMGTDLSSVQFSSETTYTDLTVWPEGFDPSAAGLKLAETIPGDFDANGILDADDLERLQDRVVDEFNYRHPVFDVFHFLGWISDAVFDLNNNGQRDMGDHRSWIKDLKQTYYGDSNLDGEFNSSDLVQVFEANEYEDEKLRNSTWITGDWDGDWEFTSSDLVIAFQDGGYEKGSELALRAVPEPSCTILLWIGVAGLFRIFRRPKCTLRLESKGQV